MDKERGRRSGQLTLEEIIDIAKEVALEYGGHVPTVIVEGSLGPRVGRFPNLPETHEERLRLMHAAGFALGKHGEVGEMKQVFLISEGWLSISEEGKPPAMQPSQDPNRKEVLFITNLALKEQRTRIAIFEMVRDTEGHLAQLRELQLPGENEEGQAENPLLEAFVKGFGLGRRGK